MTRWTMQPKSSILFKVLLNRFHPGTGESFLQNLPPSEAKEIINQNVTSTDPSVALTWKQDLLTQTHYSWLAPVIQQLPQFLQGAAAASLSEHQSSRLKSLLKIPLPAAPLSPPLKNFLIDQLYQKWNLKEILPREYLPQTPLSSLLILSKSELVELIDFLALHDLSEALRHIVNTKNLKKIYSCLTPKKQQYLRVCLHQKERVAAPKLEIDKWDGSPQEFEAMMHRRGMFRLGKAVSGQDPQFMWHLTHILDTGRGAALAKYYQKNAIPDVTPYLAQQLLFVMNFLKKKSAQ